MAKLKKLRVRTTDIHVGKRLYLACTTENLVMQLVITSKMEFNDNRCFMAAAYAICPRTGVHFQNDISDIDLKAYLKPESIGYFHKLKHAQNFLTRF